MKIAVVLFNLGGPDSPEAVQPFLKNLFSDPAIISLPAIFRLPLARLIATRRAPVAKAIYDKIVTMARQAEASYCIAMPGYYNNRDCSIVASDPDKPKSLDMEFKIFSNGDVLIKQSREFSGH